MRLFGLSLHGSLWCHRHRRFCVEINIPMFPQEFSQEQEAVIDRLVVSNSGTAGTPAGDRMAAWSRLVNNWQDRRR